MIDKFHEWSSPGVFALENHQDMTVQIFKSRNMLKKLSSLIEEFKNNISPHKKLQMDYQLGRINPYMFSSDLSEEEMKLTLDYWIESYKSRGWRFYTQHKASYYVVLVHYDFNDKSSVVQVRVALRKGKKELTVGVFSQLDEMNDFRGRYYPLGVTGNIVYATNDLTREYIKSEQQAVSLPRNV